MKTGGTQVPEAHGDSAVAAAEFVTMDLGTGAINTPVSTEDMDDKRIEHNLVILPNGHVLVIGGGRVSGDGDMRLQNAVYATEIWNPSGTGDWCTVAPMTHRSPPTPRMYHSTAVLLPSGQVLSAGGEVHEQEVCPRPNPPQYIPLSNCATADFYEPPYLFRATDNMHIDAVGTRPTVSDIPTHVAYGEDLDFTAAHGSGATDFDLFTLIRPSAVTHANDMDQRYVSLTSFTYNSGTGDVSIGSASMPDVKLAPPGYYMLFGVNDLGHPTVGEFVNLWGIIETSLQESATVTCGGTSFDISWDTTISTSSNDVLKIFAPGVNCVTEAPTASATDVSGGLQHQVEVSTTICQVGNWHYHIESTIGSSISTTGCQTYTVGSCPSCGGGQCKTGCELD